MWKPKNAENIWYYKNPGFYHYITFSGPMAHTNEEMITVYIKNKAWYEENSVFKDTVLGLSGFTFPNKCNLSIVLR